MQIRPRRALFAAGSVLCFFGFFAEASEVTALRHADATKTLEVRPHRARGATSEGAEAEPENSKAKPKVERYRRRRHRGATVPEPPANHQPAMPMGLHGQNLTQTQRKDMEKSMMQQKHWKEEAEHHAGILEAKKRRLEAETERTKATAAAMQAREEEQQRIEKIKERNRQDEMESMARQERRLREKAEYDARIAHRKQARLAAEAEYEARRLKRQQERTAAAESVVNSKKALQAEAQAHLDARVQKAQEMKASYQKRQEERAAAKVAEEQRWQAAQQEHARQREENKKRQEEWVRRHELAQLRFRLRKQAIDQRRAAQQPEFFHKLRKQEDVLASVKNATDIPQLLKAFEEIVRNERFMTKMNEGEQELLESAANLSYAVAKGHDHFVLASRNCSTQDFPPLLAGFLGTEVSLLLQHDGQVEPLARHMVHFMTPKLHENLQPFLEVFKLEAVPPSVNMTVLLQGPHEACREFKTVIENLQPLQENVTKLYKVLNATSKIIPTFNTVKPDLKTEAVAVMQTLLHAGYIEAIVLSDVTRDVMEKVVPAVDEKCGAILGGKKRRRS